MIGGSYIENDTQRRVMLHELGAVKIADFGEQRAGIGWAPRRAQRAVRGAGRARAARGLPSGSRRAVMRGGHRPRVRTRPSHPRGRRPRALQA
jgi:hypothetical protein